MSSGDAIWGGCLTKDDTVCALEMLNENYLTFHRDDIAQRSGLTILANKWNWRKQELHFYLVRRRKESMSVIGAAMKTPDGRPAMERMVKSPWFERQK